MEERLHPQNELRFRLQTLELIATFQMEKLEEALTALGQQPGALPRHVLARIDEVLGANDDAAAKAWVRANARALIAPRGGKIGGD